MTTRQTRIFVVIAVLIALTRLAAIAHSFFDWDEVLFMRGVLDYNVGLSPHPPGYPLFVLAAKGVHLLVASEFRSLQTAVTAGAMLVFPAVAWLALELGLPFAVAISGAALFAFLPNVWVYGGTALSDLPGAVAAIAASGLLLRGRRHPRALVAGAALLGIAGGIRPASLLMGAVPAVFGATAQLRARRFAAVATAIAIGGVIVFASYLGAALGSTSVADYLDALRGQSQWVRDVDSFQSATRPPLYEVAWTFLARPFGQWQQMTALLGLALLSLIVAATQRRTPPWLTLITFLPIAIFSWLMLDVSTRGRYSIAYLPMHALLAADGLAALTLYRPRLFAGASTVLIAAFAAWTWPAVRLQAGSDSPPVAAMQWVGAHLPPSSVVYVQDAFRPHGFWQLQDYDLRIFKHPAEVPLLEEKSWVMDGEPAPSGVTFQWPHDQLWRVLRQRNFTVSVRESEQIRYLDGWYGREGRDTDTFRWMGRSGEITFPGSVKRGRLTIAFHLPPAILRAAPTIEVSFNGVVLDRLRPTEEETTRAWVVLSRGAGDNELRLTTTATFSPAREQPGNPDQRELGLLLRAVFWAAEQ
ncbi:MAG TPA: hypothetical protein VFV98_16885 [Vicinamibacterales bacterium]|nr:hypothetical protein [Vicinamibacterales bacterium]